MAAERTVAVVPRVNDNRARSKSGRQRTVPVSDQVIRLYGDYLFTEYGDLDSDHVFVNLFARPRGQAWTYAGVYDLVLRLRRRTGVSFDPHWCRHAYATRAQMSRIASDASFGTSREHALPAAQRAALRPAWRAGAAGGAVTCDVSGWLHQTPGCAI